MGSSAKPKKKPGQKIPLGPQVWVTLPAVVVTLTCPPEHDCWDRHHSHTLYFSTPEDAQAYADWLPTWGYHPAHLEVGWAKVQVPKPDTEAP